MRKILFVPDTSYELRHTSFGTAHGVSPLRQQLDSGFVGKVFFEPVGSVKIYQRPCFCDFNRHNAKPARHKPPIQLANRAKQFAFIVNLAGKQISGFKTGKAWRTAVNNRFFGQNRSLLSYVKIRNTVHAVSVR